MRIVRNVVVVALAVVVAHSVAAACPSCFGAPDSPQTEGIKWAILSLLGITGTVLAGMSAFFFYLRKKTDEFNHRFSDKLN
jgi:protein-S-isoprenylcysteine O-methyltransferase Ste14